MTTNDDIKEIIKLARKVKQTRKLEQKAYNALIKGKPINSYDLADKHEMAMIATGVAERDLSSLVIRLLVNKKSLKVSS